MGLNQKLQGCYASPGTTPWFGGLELTGDIDATATAIDWDLLANNASALSFDSAALAGIMNISTLTGAESVSFANNVLVSGDFQCDGTITATLLVEDKLITLNEGGAAASGFGSGFEIEEDGSSVAYIKTSATRNEWEFKVPNNAAVLTLDLDATKTWTVGGALNVEADSNINQDVTSDATPTWAGIYTDTIGEVTGAAGVTIDGITLKDGGALDITGGSNTFNLTNGTASLDVAAACAVDVNANVTINGALTLTNALTACATNAGTIDFSAASKTLTIEDSATIGLDIAALEALSTTGIVARTAANTYATRTITGTANQITVTNGDGVSANPTLSLPTTIYLGAATIGRDAGNYISFETDDNIIMYAKDQKVMTITRGTSSSAHTFSYSSSGSYTTISNGAAYIMQVMKTSSAVSHVFRNSDAVSGSSIGLDADEKTIIWNFENTDMYFGVNNLLCATFAASDLSLTLVGNLITPTAFATTFDTNVAAAGVTLAGTTLSADGTNVDINIAITPKGAGEVDITKVDIDGGTIDGATIATSDITVGAGKTLTVSAGTLALADDQISGDKVEGGTINAITINTLTSTTVNATTFDTNIAAAGVTLAGTTLAADGTDTDISVTITPQGAGVVIADGVSIDGGTNTFSLTVGTASLDIAAGATLDVNYNLTVEAASAINQDLTTDAKATFAGMDSSGDITLLDPGSSVDSKKLIMIADSATTPQTGEIFVCYGTNPYIRFSPPNAAGAATAAVDMRSDQMSFVDEFALTTNTGASDYFLIKAVDNDDSLLYEVARVAGGTTPAFEIKAGKLTGSLDANSQTITSAGAINGITFASGTNTYSLTVGTASLDIAAGAALDVNYNLTVSGVSTINQDISTTATPTLASLKLSVLTAAPGSPVEGQICYADGTSWDPGSGKGLYFYDGAAWVPMFAVA